jgi:hypothetical protein
VKDKHLEDAKLREAALLERFRSERPAAVVAEPVRITV